jgi:hypothetical protein
METNVDMDMTWIWSYGAFGEMLSALRWSGVEDLMGYCLRLTLS